MDKPSVLPDRSRLGTMKERDRERNAGMSGRIIQTETMFVLNEVLFKVYLGSIEAVSSMK